MKNFFTSLVLLEWMKQVKGFEGVSLEVVYEAACKMGYTSSCYFAFMLKCNSREVPDACNLLNRCLDAKQEKACEAIERIDWGLGSALIALGAVAVCSTGVMLLVNNLRRRYANHHEFQGVNRDENSITHDEINIENDEFPDVVIQHSNGPGPQASLQSMKLIDIHDKQLT